MERLHLQDIIQDMEDNFDYKKYLAEGKLLKEEVDVLGNEFLQDIQDDMKMYYKMDVDMDDIKDWVNMYYIGYNSEYDEGPGDVDYEGNEFGSEDYESEKKELVFDTAEREDFYMHLNPEADSTFPNLAEGKLLKEVMDEEMVDYVSAMYDSDVDQEAEEGFQSDVWSKAQYASNAYNESSIFLELIDHLKSVGGKDVVEGNPDIELELLPNGDIRWSANVTHY